MYAVPMMYLSDLDTRQIRGSLRNSVTALLTTPNFEGTKM